MVRPRRKAFRFISILFLALALFVFGLFAFLNSNDMGNATFRSNYPQVPVDHVFEPIDAEGATDFLGKGSGVLFLGFPACPWCQSLAPHLDSVAKSNGVKRISYFDVRKDRADNTQAYQGFVKILEPSLDKDEKGEPRIYVPHIVFVKKGKVVGNYKIALPKDGTNPTPDTYWTRANIDRAKAQLQTQFDKL